MLFLFFVIEVLVGELVRSILCSSNENVYHDCDDNYSYYTWIVHWKLVNFVACKLFSNKPKYKIIMNYFHHYYHHFKVIIIVSDYFVLILSNINTHYLNRKLIVVIF